MKRIFLFVVTNLAIVLVLSVTARILGVDRILNANGLNLSALLVFAALFGFGGIAQCDPDEATGLVEIIADFLDRDIGQLGTVPISNAIDQHDAPSYSALPPMTVCARAKPLEQRPGRAVTTGARQRSGPFSVTAHQVPG